MRRVGDMGVPSWQGSSGNHRGQEELMPNMALQRTPRPRFLKVRSGTRGSILVRAHAGTGRSLRSLGSPLNARPLGDTRNDPSGFEVVGGGHRAGAGLVLASAG